MTDDIIRVGIVGHGFVGKAVDFGFEHHLVEKFLVDPKYGTTIKDLVKWQPNLVFICVPTPMGEDGAVDAFIVKDAIAKLTRNCLIVIKSTIPPDVISQLLENNKRKHIVYNPEFLTENSAAEQFINPPFHIFGGDSDLTQRLELTYQWYSNCNHCDVYHMTAEEASFVKYSINAFLATKVTFFNQLYDAVQDYGSGNFGVIVKAVGADPRIGTGHTKVPGYDMKRGFGGACFPKDIKALTKFGDLSLLEKVIEINNEYRQQYEKDAREEEQNITYD